MHHQNRNAVVSLFYNELPQQEEQKLRDHLTTCEDCREYLNELKEMGAILKHYPVEQPLPGTFDNILANIPLEQPRAVYTKPELTPQPFFRIGFAMIFILSLIYFVQDKISMQPFWLDWQKIEIIHAIGSFGLVAIVFLSIGTFITLALAPVLYFDIHKKAIRL